MKDFKDKIAVVTGGGTGMGRELVLQLAAEGAHVATCDVNDDTLKATAEAASGGGRITTHRCDVSDEAQVMTFREEVAAQHETDHVNLVFNNAGIGGGGSFVNATREEWERTFGVCWTGVYNCSRAFVPMLVASDDGYLINTSSVNGFWAKLGGDVAHTAYSAAKFDVKGFSEALITDFALNAPHVKVAVVMPGHIGTDIITNTVKLLWGSEPPATDDDQIYRFGEMFKETAVTTAAEAATIILDGVREEKWRILVGPDAERLDEFVRNDPLAAYEPGFGMQSLQSSVEAL